MIGWRSLRGAPFHSLAASGVWPQFRHFNAYAWSINTWIGNVTAGLIIFAVVGVFGFLFRRSLKRAFDWCHHHLVGKRHLAVIEAAIEVHLASKHADLAETVKSHVTSEVNRLIEALGGHQR